jgi:polysaccharide export outer membrane protein
MGRSVLIFLRLSMIASALALLVFCVRAASAQDASAQAPSGPVQPQKAQSYGFVPVQNSTPDSQPYGIKPIPGYTPPQGPTPEPPQQLRGAFETAPVLPERQPQNTYGYVPLRQTAPSPSAQQPQLRNSSTTYDNSDAVYDNPRSNSPRDGVTRINAGYQLGAGDKIRVTVFGESDLSGEYQVDGSGLVRLPLIGTLRATGYTAPDLEQGISAALSDGYIKNPRVNVEIATYRPFYIIGAVNRPGQYAYIDHMNALNAVALAGGFTDQAIQSTLYIRHEGSAAEQPVQTNQLSHVEPGDVIRVKTSLFWDAMNLFSPIAGPAAIAAATLR